MTCHNVMVELICIGSEFILPVVGSVIILNPLPYSKWAVISQWDGQ
jgi:hypothetical protein